MFHPEPLSLLAMDEEDLGVISAALQDAIAHVGDIIFEPNSKRLTVVFNRYRWEANGGSRVRSALQLGYVQSVQVRNVRRTPKDAAIDLLSLDFKSGAEVPAGSLVMTFAGGGNLRAEVECIDAVLADVSEPWPTRRRPAHRD